MLNSPFQKKKKKKKKEKIKDKVQFPKFIPNIDKIGTIINGIIWTMTRIVYKPTEISPGGCRAVPVHWQYSLH